MSQDGSSTLAHFVSVCIMKVIVNGKLADWTIPEPR